MNLAAKRHVQAAETCRIEARHPSEAWSTLSRWKIWLEGTDDPDDQRFMLISALCSPLGGLAEGSLLILKNR